MKAFVVKYQITCFIVIAFAISLLIGLPLKLFVLNDLFADSELGLNYFSKTLVVFGPALAGLIVISITDGTLGIKAYLGKLEPHADHIIWWISLPLAGIVITLLAFIAGGFSPGQLAEYVVAVSPMLLLMHIGGACLVLGLGEELGWRGWLLPKLAEGRSLKKAMLMVFAIWALWHLPLFFSGWRIVLPFIVIVFALSVIFTWLWDRVGGNVFVLVIAHASVDFPQAFFESRVGEGHEAQIQNAWTILALIYLVIAIGVYILGRRNLDVVLEQTNERLLPGEMKEKVNGEEEL
ncbi:CPBP family intramembrane glutamic endopeptidase [Mucilaginibacter psychrotolerans]|uniref:CPBP family intramembrane metalloprotease n=1 Tax=Mucilaginibacter psychrotolerans TaxID=1524096 RepID=A0A4Y8SIJ2_9SPHI|nr:type II CAAX endopeptidase family protein [Mucilaginibacter psychrotolerans]TFF38254.1 CPBP family intramembrane metalloprotease [Mucilaginibacter psychrotolerans]